MMRPAGFFAITLALLAAAWAVPANAGELPPSLAEMLRESNPQERDTLINGELYANTYVFVFRIRDGRIASIAEHFNALVVQEKMIPLVAQLRDSDEQE